MESAYIVVMTTCATDDQAKEIATSLINNRLAACVQSNPISSTYRWEGKIEHDTEVRLMIKTTAANFEMVKNFIQERHSYDNPQIISVPIIDGSENYLNWLRAEVE